MAVRFNKDRKAWFVDITHDHIPRFRKYSPENSKAGALAYEALLRHKLARGEPIGKTEAAEKGFTFEQFAWKWFDEYVVPNNRYQEQRMKRYRLSSSLVPFFGKISIEQITTQKVEQYKAFSLKKGRSKKTVNNHLAVLGKCVRTAYEWLEIKGVPPKIALLKCPPPHTNHLSLDECILLLSSTEGVVREMILLALRTGMRQGELRGLQWSSINWESRSITVRHSLTDRINDLESPKNNRTRTIPIPSDIYEILLGRKRESGFVFLDENGRPYDSQRILRLLHKVREGAGLRKFTWHTLRHTYATLFAAKGMPLNMVQALLGHSSITTTMRYAHVAPSALRSTIDLLSPKMTLEESSRQPEGNKLTGPVPHEVENA